METADTRAKLANGIRQLQASGDTASIDKLVSAYKAKYQTTQAIPKTTIVNKSIDQKLSNLPGLVGGITSGIYNAGKGLAQLGGSAIVDTFNAINHPIDTGKKVASFVGSELTGGAKPETLDTLGNFVQGTLGTKGLLGIAQQPGQAIATGIAQNDIVKMHDEQMKAYDKSTELRNKLKTESDPARQELLKKAIKANDEVINNYTENINALNESKSQTNQGEIAGTALNSALLALTSGSGNLGAQAVENAVKTGLVTDTVGQFLKSAATSFVGRSLQTGGIMTGFQVGTNLQEGIPVTEGAKQAFFSGTALPGVLQGTGKVIGKITPSTLTPEAGALSLKKAIGFRGNIKEKAQWDKSVPTVFKDLKDSGFKLSDATDPNNLISLDKAVETKMSEILRERTARIKATGENSTVSGDLAAQKIRNLIESGSVEDLTTPGARARLEEIAKNFEGKQYEPVEAQKAIVQANTGFSFSDNPAMSKQIKMAISQAFTPELDRIVAGTEKVKYDAKGKPIPAIGGTAELSKKWSAYKTFQEQLQKKINLEERRATYDLPTRLTGAQVAGKVGEAVGNPLVIPQKLVGGGVEYLANKLMGDRNNVNYRIYKAFNGNTTGEAIVGMLNKFQKVSDIVKFLEQNPLIKHLLDKVVPTESTLQNTNPEWAKTNRTGGYVSFMRDIKEKQVTVKPVTVNKLTPQYEAQVQELVKIMAEKNTVGAKFFPSNVAQEIRSEFLDFVNSKKSREYEITPQERRIEYQKFFDKAASNLGGKLQLQSHKSIGVMYDLAPKAKTYLDSTAKNIADSTGNRFVSADIKSMESVIRKLDEVDISGNHSRIHDLTRNTIVLDKPGSYNTIVEALKKKDPGSKIKVQSPEDYMGYSGTIVNIKTPNGLVGEIQITTPKMLFGKLPPELSLKFLGKELFDKIAKETGAEPGKGHVIYEKWRKLTKEQKESPAGKAIHRESVDYYSKLR